MIYNYPNTNFHDLNLDWFLAEFKKVMDRLLNLEDAFATLKEYVDEYFRNLDLQEEVNNYFNSLIDSGEIYTLLSKYFGSNLVDDALFSLYGQVVPDRAVRFDPDISSQGMCIGEKNGRPVMMNCFIDGADDNNVIVWTYMDTGVVLNTINIQAGHNNSCAFNPDNGHYYIACSGARDALMELDENGVIYREEIIDGRDCWGVTYNRGKIYALLGGTMLAIINPNNWSEYELIPFSTNFSKFTYQGICSDDQYLYIFNGNRITHVDQGTINLNRISVFSHKALLIKTINSLFPLETEEGDIYDGELYLSGNSGKSAIIVKSDLYYQSRWNDLGFINDNVEVNKTEYDIYVDEQYTDYFMDGTSDHPISNLAWLNVYLKNSITRLNVHIVNDIVSTPTLSVRRFPQIVLDFQADNHKFPVLFSNCKELYMSNAVIDGVDDTYSIEYHGSRLVLNSITFGEPGSAVVPKRLVFSTSNYEINTITINQAAEFMFYLLGSGYIRNVTVNTAHLYQMMVESCSTRSFPINSVEMVNPDNNTQCPIRISDYNTTIDMAKVNYPCYINHIGGGTITNMPASVTLSDLTMVECIYVRSLTGPKRTIMINKYYMNDSTMILERRVNNF